MNSILVYSLSEEIIEINSSLKPEIQFIQADELDDILTNIQPNGIIFEKSQITVILKCLHHKNAYKNRFICIGNNLESDDRLMLLNNNIEFITHEKYIGVTSLFFEIGNKIPQSKILIVEDDESQVLITEHILKNADFEVYSITKGEEIISALDTFKPNLILMDLYLQGITGDKLVKVVRKKHPNLPIVFLTADTSVETRMDVLNAGADDLLTKPIIADLLVSALKNRIQRSVQLRSDSTHKNIISTSHPLENESSNKLDEFLKSHVKNNKASIIWIKIVNKHSLLSKVGFFGFNKLAHELYEKTPLINSLFSNKTKLTDGVFALTSNNLERKNAIEWVKKLQKWLTRNHYSLTKKDYYLKVNAVILSDIPAKNNPHLLIKKAENTLIDAMNNQSITLVEEGIEEKKFYLIKTQIENAIKTRNLKWVYQTIISTKDESKEIYQLMLRVITDSGNELKNDEYLDTAKKTGLLRLLDRFTLEHAIRLIRAGEQKKINTQALLNQNLSDYQSPELTSKKLNIIKNLNLPNDSIMFQFDHNDAMEYTSILGEVGKQLKRANINVCLSSFDCSNAAWKSARKLNVSWIRLKSFSQEDFEKNKDKFAELKKVINKAHTLGYQVIVSKVDSAGFASNLWKLDIDYLQGDFIQAPISQD